MADGRSYERARVMRRALTPPEATLWAQLKGKGLEGFRFRRQHPVGPYVLDFYCAAARLAVEVDGLIHGNPDQARHDAYRDGWLRRQGISVLRIPATEVRHQLEGVMALLLHTLRARGEGRRGLTPPVWSRPLHAHPMRLSATSHRVAEKRHHFKA